MSKYASFYDTVDQIVSYGVDKGILHLYTATDSFNGIHLIINNKSIRNFGSCSYLGLEFEERLRTAAKEAIEKYGTQFSESRAYVSLGSYKELESLLDQIFDAHCVITPTTTLGHIANIPVMVNDGDAIILDQQVHNSVQTAVQIVKARGVLIEVIRHNRMDLLEERILALRDKYKKIWYMADGIYSMFGDCAPVEAIYQLMDKYPELHFYVDDAHGMSIHGTHGRGYVLSRHQIRPKMVLATSLNKAFASGGGVLVYHDRELARKVGTVGGPLLSSGPMQPASIGAAIAAAKIHLSTEITSLQDQLSRNITYTNLLLKKYQLPVISKTGAAIFFVGVSLPKLGHNLVRRMLDAGFYVNLGVFPTVPMKQTGIRFTITRLHTFRDIESMISRLANEFPEAMLEENITLPEIYKAFKMPVPEAVEVDQSVRSVLRQTLSLKVSHFKSINEVDRGIWDEVFSGKGTFDWNGMQILEKSFADNLRDEDNWLFDYVLVADTSNQIIAATFFTTAIWKDDMLSHSSISGQVEVKRQREPYLLTSKVICTGSLITEGEHCYLNKDNALWKDGLQLLLEKAYSLQDEYHADHIMFRDFHALNEIVDHQMADNGFFRIDMPPTHVISKLDWNTPEEFYTGLSSNGRTQLRKKVLRFQQDFLIEHVEGNVTADILDRWYDLYLNVKNKSLELNTFALPKQLFFNLLQSPDWEVLRIHLDGHKEVCVIFCYKGQREFIPMIIGMDYTADKKYNVYRQALYQVILRARQLGKSVVHLGFSATIEKQKLGATPLKTFGYLHMKDSYNAEILSAFSTAVPQILKNDA